MPVFALLNLNFSADLDFALAGPVDFRKLVAVGDNAAGGKIRPLDIFHQLLGRNLRVVQAGDLRVDDLAQIVGRRRGRHTDRDALGAVDQEIRDPDRQNRGFLLCLVKIRNEVDDILIQVRQEGVFRDLLQPCFRVTHGRRAVSLDIAEVAVAVHERNLFLEVLRHHHQRVIDGRVAVRMEFTHGIADDTGALAVRFVRMNPQLLHIIERPALDGL